MENLVKNKTCTKCNVVLPAVVGNFYKDSQKRDGLSSACSDCCRKKKYETFIKTTSDKLKEQRRLKKQSYLESEEYKVFLEKSKEKTRLCKKRWRDKNRDLINEKSRLKPRKEISLEKKRQYKKNEYNKIMNDPYKKLIHYTRVRMNDCLREKKDFSVKGVIYFNHDDFVNHISSLFKDGMSWDNYGKNGWHVDHIKPLASFDLSNEEDLKEALSLQNLQPLWGGDNCAKGSLYEGVRHKKISHPRSNTTDC